MVDIKVLEKGIPYICYVDEDVIFMYIKENEDIMNGLDDEQKFLKAIYKMWTVDKHFLECRSYNIPENSPHYGKKWYCMENISLDDIKWDEDETPSKVLNRILLKAECTVAMAETLGLMVDSCYIGIDIGGNFFIGLEYVLLYFCNNDLSFKNGDFSGKYRLKKNRADLINTVHKAIIKNENLIRDYLQS